MKSTVYVKICVDRVQFIVRTEKDLATVAQVQFACLPCHFYEFECTKCIIFLGTETLTGGKVPSIFCTTN